MQKRHLIEVTKFDKQRKRYCIVRHDFEEFMTDYMSDFKPIEKDLKRKDLTNDERVLLIGNDIRLAYYKFDSLNVGRLYQEYVHQNKEKIELVERAKKVLWNRIQEKIRMLSENDKKGVLDTLLTTSLDMLSLTDYRKMRSRSNIIDF